MSTLNDDPPILSDREFVIGLAAQLELILDTLNGHGKQLDHIDTMCHETAQFIEEHRPALAKALAFLSPGRSVRDYFGKGRTHPNE